MKYEYLKGSEKDFEGAPEWATKVLRDNNDSKKSFVGELGGITLVAEKMNPHSWWKYNDGYVGSLIAERRPITEPVWSGAWLPPVGARVEYRGNDTSWGEVKIIGYDEGKVVFKPSGEDYYGIKPSHKAEFIPIRSPEDVARDEAITSLHNTYMDIERSDGVAEGIYGAIAAGKIPGITLSGK